MFIFRAFRPVAGAALCLLAALLLGGCVLMGKSSPGTPRARLNGIEMTARVEPSPLKLGETRRATVTVHLKNRSSRYVRLAFPTTQRLEVIARDAKGRQLLAWSEDQAFEDVPCSVGINPGEHLEYRAVIGTRDFIAGQRHVISVSIPGYPQLSLDVPVTPEP